MNATQTATTTVCAGDRCVTVGRDGSSHDRFGNGIYTTKVYEARVSAAGRLAWRLATSVSDHRTAGKRITGPMRRRAQAWADAHGLPYRAGVTQHQAAAPAAQAGPA